MKRISESFNKGFGIVLFAALFMFFVKLYFSYHVYGTNDISYWYLFSRIIDGVGTFKIYPMIKLYNHPPLMSWVLKLIYFIQLKTHLRYPYLFRLMPITADFLSIIVIWKLLNKYLVKNRVLICLICAINPINFLVSGFHGNTDTVFVFFLLCTFYFIEENKIVLAGIIYGLSMCIKIVPVIFIPVFFYYFTAKDQRNKFFIFSLLVPLVVFLPYLIYDYKSVIRNIFLYKSLIGTWGIGHILNCFSRDEHVNAYLRKLTYCLNLAYIASIKPVFLLTEIKLVKFLTNNRKLNLLELSFLTFSLFLTLTAGFGIQYLSWLSLFAVIAFPLIGSIYVFLGGFFLYRVYVFWGGGVYPYFANCEILKRWHGFNEVLDILLWLLIVIMLIKFLADKKVFSHV